MTMVEIIAIIATGVLCVLCIICVVAAISSRSQARANSRAIKDIEKSLSSFGDSIKQKTDQLIDHMDKQVDELQEQRLELLEQEVLRLTRLEEEANAALREEYDFSGGEEIAAPEAVAPDTSGLLDAAGAEEELYGPGGAEEIEEIDDEIELDDLFRELNAMNAEQPESAPEFIQEQPPQPAQPQPVQQFAQPQPAQPQAAPQQQFTQQPPQQAPAPWLQFTQPVQQQAVPPQPQAAPPQPAQVFAEETRYHQGYNIGRSGKRYTAEELNALIRE